MPDETQNTESNSPAESPQAPTEPASENTGITEPSDALSEAPESSRGDLEAKSIDIPTSIEPEKELENKGKIPLKPTDSLASPSFNGTSSEPETAQIPVNEPLDEPKPEEPEAHKKLAEVLKDEILRII